MRTLNNEEINAVAGGAGSETPFNLGAFLALGFFAAIGVGATVLVTFLSTLSNLFNRNN